MKTFEMLRHRQFYPGDMASLAWSTSRVGKTWYGTVWTTTGFCDMKNLPRSLSRHARSKNNIQNQNCFKNFWKRNDILWLERRAETKYQLHNAKVRENREILKDLINVNCFPVKQQLAFCSNDESSISSNRCNYVELLHTLAAKDERLTTVTKTTTVFSGFSNIIQKSERFNCSNRWCG